MLISQPADWPIDAPPYHSAKGWEYEKKMVYERLKKQLCLPTPS